MIRVPSQTVLGLAVVVAWSTLTSTTTAADPPAVTWRSDYNAARKEATEKGKLIVLVVGTEDCLYCRKQEASTFREATVLGLIQDHFLAVKIDANQEQNLASALKIQLYPTTVIAGPDGKILAYLQGFVSADQFKEHAKRAVLQATAPDAVVKQLDDVNKSITSGDYLRAVVVLKQMLSELEDSPARMRAERMLKTIEQHAVEKLLKAKQLDEAGEGSASMTQLAELVRYYAGTPAAAEAASLLVVPARGNWSDRVRAMRARDLLTTAKDDYDAKRYAECLEKCQFVQAQHPESTEAKHAKIMADNIRNEPEVLLSICEQMNERTAGLYLALAETWSRKGDVKQAQVYFERVMALHPGSKTADAAQVHLASIKKGLVPTIPASIQK